MGIVSEQNSKVYRFSLEPFILSASIELFAGQKILDVGIGNGIIPSLLLARQPDLSITAIEIQNELYEMAVRNAKENKIESTLKLIRGDFIMQKLPLNGPFDVIVSNPPYRKLNSGRINQGIVKAIARHELKMDLSSLVRKAAFFLRMRGKILLAYPQSRLREVLNCLILYGFTPTRLRHVHGRVGLRSKFFLVEGVKGDFEEPLKEDSFYVQCDNNQYAPEMKAIYVSINSSGRSYSFW